MSSPPPGWPNPHADAGVEDTLALLPPDALWPPLPPPDLSRPPPWLLPPPPAGMPPPSPPPGGWASSWETAVAWPPPPAPPEAQGTAYGGSHAGWAPPGGDAGAYSAVNDEAYDEGDYDEGEEDEEYDAGASFVPGEVVWRAGDALDDEDDDEEEAPEIALELSEEWAARFAQTEHRRAQRKLQERAANRQGQAPEPQRSSAGAGAPTPGAPAGPPLTVVDIVRAAGAGASQPNEELYGAEYAARIAALEAAVQARYAKALSGGKANLWPCEPLRNA